MARDGDKDIGRSSCQCGGDRDSNRGDGVADVALRPDWRIREVYNRGGAKRFENWSSKFRGIASPESRPLSEIRRPQVAVVRVAQIMKAAPAALLIVAEPQFLGAHQN